MRQAALATAPIKQIALIGPNGEILCTDAGESVEHHQVLTSAATRSSGVTFDVVRQTDRGERFLRIRQSAGRDDKPEITALVPAGLLLPQAPTQGGRSLGYARIAMSDGTPVAASGVVADTMAHEAQFVDVLRSKRYPLVITVSMSRSGAVANYDDLRRIGMVIAVGIALVILLCALLFYRRRWIDPAAAWPRRSGATSSCRTTSRSSIFRPGSCSAPRCWCVGVNPTAVCLSRTHLSCFWSRMVLCWTSRAN